MWEVATLTGKTMTVIEDAGDGDLATKGEEPTDCRSCPLRSSMMWGVVMATREAALGERNGDRDGVAEFFLRPAESSLVLDGSGEEEGGDG